jgi:hypothetical protein
MYLMVEPPGDQVAIPMPDGGEVLVDPRQRRARVVRRLLRRGVTSATLRLLLPDWIDLIDRTERELRRTDCDPRLAS